MSIKMWQTELSEYTVQALNKVSINSEIEVMFIMDAELDTLPAICQTEVKAAKEYVKLMDAYNHLERPDNISYRSWEFVMEKWNEDLVDASHALNQAIVNTEKYFEFSVGDKVVASRQDGKDVYPKEGTIISEWLNNDTVVGYRVDFGDTQQYVTTLYIRKASCTPLVCMALNEFSKLEYAFRWLRVVRGYPENAMIVGSM